MKLSRVLLVVGLCGTAGLVRALQTPEVDPLMRTQTTYYASGQVRTRGTFRDGRRDGLAQSFYPDGTKQSEGAYANGQMDGPWTFWLPNGDLDGERTGNYSGGVRGLP